MHQQQLHRPRVSLLYRAQLRNRPVNNRSRLQHRGSSLRPLLRLNLSGRRTRLRLRQSQGVRRTCPRLLLCPRLNPLPSLETVRLRPIRTCLLRSLSLSRSRTRPSLFLSLNRSSNLLQRKSLTRTLMLQSMIP